LAAVSDRETVVASPLLPSGTSPPIRRHALAAIKAPIFLGGPIALIAPRLKIGLGAF
jgi:hypothetical protein